MTDSSSASTWITRGWSTTIGYSNRTSDNVDAPHSAAAAESVCNRTDTGTTSTPWIRWPPGYGLASGTSRACQRCAGGVVATAMCSPSRVPDLGADPAASTRLLILIQCCVWCQGVVGRRRMGFGRVREAWWVGGVGGVEVGVEGEGVVGVALQGSDAVVVRAAEGVADGVGQQRMRADFDEGAWSAPAAATAWLNRTGLRRLAAQ